MTQGLAGFVNTGSASLQSTYQHVDYENVTQGGNFVLATGPLFLQATYAGAILAEVAGVASGALYGIAQFFQCVFHPLISLPLAFISTAVRGHFYEKSVSVTAMPTTKYYAKEYVDEEEETKGTVTLSVGGKDRHYLLGANIDWYIGATTVVNGKRYWYCRANQGEDFDRTVEINGEQVRVQLQGETNKSFVEMKIGETKRYFELGNEVSEPVETTISITHYHMMQQPVYAANLFFRLVEIPEEQAGCVKVTSEEMTLFYDTGIEIDQPGENSYTFLIDGVERHFATAKYVKNPSEGISGWINIASQHFLGISLLPTRISKLSSEILTYMNEHASNFIRLALIVAGVALLYFGQVAMAAGTFMAVGYEYLDHDLGVIPHDVSLFMEKWLPTVSLAGLLLVGSTFWQLFAGASLLLSIPSVQLFVHQQLAKVIRQAGIPLLDRFIMLFQQGERPPQLDELIENVRALPQIEEIDAPLIERREMGLAEIQEILNGRDNEYQLNPASLSKNVEPLIELPEDRNYSKLLELWDQIGDEWRSPALYQKLLRKLADDERFIEFLKIYFPEAQRFHFVYDVRNQMLTQGQQYQVAFDNYCLGIQEKITQLLEGDVTKEQFVARWAREQLQHFVNKLNGAQSIAGERRLLVESMENVAKTIPFLTDENANPLDLKNDLIELSIGGGNYCTLGMRRASKIVLDNHKGPLLHARAAQLSPEAKYEYDIKELFQISKLQAIQGFYKIVTDWLRNSEHTQTTADDVHLYEAVVRAIKRTFYPMTQEEMEQFSITELLLTETVLLPVRAGLWNEFVARIPEAMRVLAVDPLNQMRNRCVGFLRNWAQNNPNLSQEERQQLLNGPFAEDIVVEEPNMGHKLDRLMLMILGIYRKKPPVAA